MEEGDANKRPRAAGFSASLAGLHCKSARNDLEICYYQHYWSTAQVNKKMLPNLSTLTNNFLTNALDNHSI
uniref:Uncharacterized protein n=1 Tax=Arundo donax TaxID=35708 RepID=A0A0A9DGB1_ARUDO